MKYLLYALIIASLLGCVKQSKEPNFKVKHKGALKNFMMKGDISAKISLSEFEKSDDFYALGAMENLKGEIQIFDSNPLNTVVIDSSLLIDRTFGYKASLLVYALVEQWTSIAIPRSISTYSDLEEFIANAAKENKINVAEAFPFLIEGEVKSIDWHVIDWDPKEAEVTHEKHKESGLNGSLVEEDVVLLGFYSDNHKGIFTHHSTSMHIHMKTLDEKVAGHMDDIKLGSNMILKLPLVE